jgi:hypothetical protein
LEQGWNVVLGMGALMQKPRQNQEFLHTRGLEFFGAVQGAVKIRILHCYTAQALLCGIAEGGEVGLGLGIAQGMTDDK